MGCTGALLGLLVNANDWRPPTVSMGRRPDQHFLGSSPFCDYCKGIWAKNAVFMTG